MAFRASREYFYSPQYLEIELKELKLHHDELLLNTCCFDLIYQLLKRCHNDHDLQSHVITLGTWSLHKALRYLQSHSSSLL